MDGLWNFIAERRRYLMAKMKTTAKISIVMTTLTSGQVDVQMVDLGRRWWRLLREKVEAAYA